MFNSISTCERAIAVGSERAGPIATATIDFAYLMISPLLGRSVSPLPGRAGDSLRKCQPRTCARRHDLIVRRPGDSHYRRRLEPNVGLALTGPRSSAAHESGISCGERGDFSEGCLTPLAVRTDIPTHESPIAPLGAILHPFDD